MTDPRPAQKVRTAPPRIPVPPPPRVDPRRARKQSDARLFVWVGALAAGVGAGVAGYQLLPVVVLYFDYWLALLLG